MESRSLQEFCEQCSHEYSIDYSKSIEFPNIQMLNAYMAQLDAQSDGWSYFPMPVRVHHNNVLFCLYYSKPYRVK